MVPLKSKEVEIEENTKPLAKFYFLTWVVVFALQ